MGKFFDFEIFGLKYVLKHSESIPTKKIFDQIFLTLSFFQAKNFFRGKVFDFEIFVSKYVSKHSESIPTKKIFDQIFLT